MTVNDRNRLTLETLTRDCLTLVEMLAAVIAHSQIVVAQTAQRAALLPTGFDDVDVAILDWIAAEGRRVGRNFRLQQ